MRILKILFIVLLFSGVSATAASFFIPNTFVIERSNLIPAASFKVNRQIMLLKNWESWWPWNSVRKKASFTIPEREAGSPAQVRWEGRPASGMATVKKQTVWELSYEVQLDGNTSPDALSFSFQELPEGTHTTVRYEGHFETPVLGSYLALLADSMHGGMFDWGLDNIGALAQKDEAEIITE